MREDWCCCRIICNSSQILIPFPFSINPLSNFTLIFGLKLNNGDLLLLSTYFWCVNHISLFLAIYFLSYLLLFHLFAFFSSFLFFLELCLCIFLVYLSLPCLCMLIISMSGWLVLLDSLLDLLCIVLVDIVDSKKYCRVNLDVFDDDKQGKSSGT